MCTRTQEKGAVTPQETEPDLPVSVRESPVEAWVTVACCRVGGTECYSVWKEVHIIFTTSTIVWSQVKQQGGHTALPINRKLD